MWKTIWRGGKKLSKGKRKLAQIAGYRGQKKEPGWQAGGHFFQKKKSSRGGGWGKSGGVSKVVGGGGKLGGRGKEFCHPRGGKIGKTKQLGGVLGGKSKKKPGPGWWGGGGGGGRKGGKRGGTATGVGGTKARENLAKKGILAWLKLGGPRKKNLLDTPGGRKKKRGQWGFPPGLLEDAPALFNPQWGGKKIFGPKKGNGQTGARQHGRPIPSIKTKSGAGGVFPVKKKKQWGGLGGGGGGTG